MEKNKIKPLTQEQIIISLDRLTRFKPTEEKYLRVFKDIITSNLIYPKYKKKELDLMDYKKLVNIVEEIFEFSLCEFGINSSGDCSVNKKLFQYEKSIFKFNKNVEKLLDNKIDYKIAINLIKNDEKIPSNLKWLKSLSKENNQISERFSLGLKFPLEKIVLVEGITEEILLPKFALLCGFDFDKAGIHLISAGGKNQVVKLFYQLSNILKLPIFVLLDNDAEENYEELKPKLRKNDEVYIIKKGEFEDILPLNLIKRTLNRNFKEYFSIKLDELRLNEPMTKTLTELFKQHGFEFKKAEFAAQIEQNLSDAKDASEEIKSIVSNLCSKN